MIPIFARLPRHILLVLAFLFATAFAAVPSAGDPDADLTASAQARLPLTHSPAPSGIGREPNTTMTAPSSPAPPVTAASVDVEVVLSAGSTVGRHETTTIGLTHTQHSVDSWGSPAAVARARKAIPAIASFQNQHIYGWGTLNPNERPGEYDWRSLDARIEMMRATGATPVITLCCAPDWMTGGVPGTTDWSRLEMAPLPAHFDDFADLARRVALRYPDVRHFQVWNELKGFWNPQLNRWDHESYTELYNRVYRALKSVDPGISVGGPYVVVGSWANASQASHPSALSGEWGVADRRDLKAIKYWLQHAEGADFVSIDAWTGTRDQRMHIDPFDATTKFRDIGNWLQMRTNLPIWWSEWHYTPQYPQPYDGEWTEQRVAALTVRSLLELSAGGSDVALHWAPQPEGSPCGACLWSDTRTSSGGQLSATGRAVRLFHRHLAGRPHDVLAHDAPGLIAVTTSSHVVVVNELDRARTLSIDGRVLEVPAYGVVAQQR